MSVVSELVDKMYTIAWIDTGLDSLLDKKGLSYSMPKVKFEKFKEELKKNGVKNITKNKFLDEILERYREGFKLAGGDKLTRLSDLPSVNNKIPLGVSRNELATYEKAQDVEGGKSIYGRRTASPEQDEVQAYIDKSEFMYKPESDKNAREKINSGEYSFKEEIKKAIEDPKQRGDVERGTIDVVFRDILDKKLGNENMENIYLGPRVSDSIKSNLRKGDDKFKFRESKTPKLTSLIFGYYG